MRTKLFAASVFAISLGFSTTGNTVSIYETSGSYSSTAGVCVNYTCQGKVASIYNSSGSHSYVEIAADRSALSCVPVNGKYLRYENDEAAGGDKNFSLLLSAKTINKSVSIHLDPSTNNCDIWGVILE